MTSQAGARLFRRLSSALLLSSLASALAGCEDPETFVPQNELGGPSGVIDGTLTYTGAPPCTENGAIVGNAILLAFDTRLLPPPQGLGTSAASIAVIPGETLFSSIRDTLTFDPSGARKCPEDAAPPVTVSASWTVSPLPAGAYQVRGFFDRDNDFDPTFLIANLPSAGDVGGGAIENAAEVLIGAPPRYREITLGTLRPNGTRVIPPEGARATGIAVTLGLKLPLERPVFYPSAVKDPALANNDPNKVVMPSDFQFSMFGANESAFLRIEMMAGVRPEEIEAASVSPFYMPVKPQPAFVFMVEDVNRDGKYDAKDHVPDSELLPSLYPLSLFTRLATGQKLVGQARPRVILQGLTLYKSLLETAMVKPMDPDPMNPMPTMPFQGADTKLVVALRPATVCIDPLDPATPGVLVVSHETDQMGTPILTDEQAVRDSLAQQFGRPFEIAYACLPEGQYAMNLVYPTGQAWTLPNEAGVCAALEPQTSDGAKCRSATSERARLASQDAILTIGPPNDPAYCAAHPTPVQCKALSTDYTGH
ncbi:hypothetical protein [Polyangium aurulentum]|uniref:hypothetical protein n=1 Tax=Polyangium aurulentum TaxID=2567896 RepID=UPI0010AE8FB6|nr:hypothetical protein [Polyangium aurulentum]UQA58755.1 hypothetical protein E8A73_047275 [Polyangium aurulentum]